MTDWLNSWKDFERICSVSGITPEVIIPGDQPMR